MKLLNTKTGETYDAVIQEIEWEELEALSDNEDFGFDWMKEDRYAIYKIRIVDENEILGLMSIIDIKHEFRVHINLIESARFCRGRDKEIDRVIGCLIAYACKLSFKAGYNGFVSLVPKTRLIDHYCKHYGFSQMGRELAVLSKSANALISKYIDDEKI